MFDVGQKVVCINDRFEEWVKRLYTALPVKDRTYVIRDVRPGIGYDEKGEAVGKISLLLIGLINPQAAGRESSSLAERGFDSDRFRPLEDFQKDDRASESERQVDLIGTSA